MVSSLAIASQKNTARVIPILPMMFACLTLIFTPISFLKAESMSQASFNMVGDFRPGGLLFGHITTEQTVYYRGEQVLVNPHGQFVIGLDRDHEGDLMLNIVQQDGSKVIHKFIIQPREYLIQSIKGVAKKYVSPDPQQLARTRSESARVRTARKQLSLEDAFFDGFIWPAKGPITGVFGSQRIFNGEPRRPHYGLDIAGPIGAEVIAPAAGIVRLAEDLFFSGMTMVIDHGHGLSSSFLHLSEMIVAAGESVEQGQLIARIGDTGRVTGPHLDWRMNWQLGAVSVRVDPQQLVKIGENRAELNP
tara:strand:- start:12320 stop:13234 length:915 start_codon:yes stop_codon:yes gene_type:complete